MYKLCSYNDDCVIDTRTNTVIFNTEKEYANYEDWARVFIRDNNLIREDKQAALRHNRGVPIRKENAEGNIEESSYHHSGQLFEKKVYKDNELIELHKYVIDPNAKKNADTKLYHSIFYKDGELSRENIYTPEGNIQKRVINYYTDRILNTSVMIYAEEGHLYMKLKYKSNKLVNYVKYNNVGNKTVEVSYDDKGKLSKASTFYASEGSLQSEKDLSIYNYKEDGIVYKEYYANGNIRAEGNFNASFEMDGEWTFYHMNRITEATYNFNKGEIIKGKVYHEDGSLIANI